MTSKTPSDVQTFRAIISESEWDSFSSWAEELEETGECTHDDDSYEPWLEDAGRANAAEESERLYDVMLSISGTGACACAAGQGLFRYPEAESIES